VINIRAKFEVSIASTVREIWRNPKILKVSHVAPSRPIWPNFAFFR